MRATSCDEGLGTLETVLGVDKTPIHHHDQPCKPPILEIPQKPQQKDSMMARGSPRIRL